MLSRGGCEVGGGPSFIVVRTLLNPTPTVVGNVTSFHVIEGRSSWVAFLTAVVRSAHPRLERPPPPERPSATADPSKPSRGVSDICRPVQATQVDRLRRASRPIRPHMSIDQSPADRFAAYRTFVNRSGHTGAIARHQAGSAAVRSRTRFGAGARDSRRFRSQNSR